jgi:hypothetical protein
MPHIHWVARGTYTKPYGDPQKKKKEEPKLGQGRVKVEGFRLYPQDPRPSPVSDVTVSGAYPSRCSERPEYNK